MLAASNRTVAPRTRAQSLRADNLVTGKRAIDQEVSQRAEHIWEGVLAKRGPGSPAWGVADPGYPDLEADPVGRAHARPLPRGPSWKE